MSARIDPGWGMGDGDCRSGGSTPSPDGFLPCWDCWTVEACLPRVQRNREMAARHLFAWFLEVGLFSMSRCSEEIHDAWIWMHVSDCLPRASPDQDVKNRTLRAGQCMVPAPLRRTYIHRCIIAYCNGGTRSRFHDLPAGRSLRFWGSWTGDKRLAG